MSPIHRICAQERSSHLSLQIANCGLAASRDIEHTSTNITWVQSPGTLDPKRMQVRIPMAFSLQKINADAHTGCRAVEKLHVLFGMRKWAILEVALPSLEVGTHLELRGDPCRLALIHHPTRHAVH